MPATSLVDGVDEGTFLYDKPEDIVRDVRNYTSCLDYGSALEPASRATCRYVAFSTFSRRNRPETFALLLRRRVAWDLTG